MKGFRTIAINAALLAGGLFAYFGIEAPSGDTLADCVDTAAGLWVAGAASVNMVMRAITRTPIFTSEETQA
jgi:hypothetical protein